MMFKSHILAMGILLVIIGLALLIPPSGRGQQEDVPHQGAGDRTHPVPPTFADVTYGRHERNVLDFWKAVSEKPSPLVMFIHGGGFRRGDKVDLYPHILRKLLASGISVAAVNYRFVPDHPLPAAHHDCRQALQFLRSKAEAWSLDKRRIGALGSSAGAQLGMWLAFHDEMAEPQSDDPLARESTRLACVVSVGGQTTMDFTWWKKWIPGYDKPHRPLSEYFGHRTPAERDRIIHEISALPLITKNDPPIYMMYEMPPDEPVPTDDQSAYAWQVHHVMFGIKLKEKMDALGLEADLEYPGVATMHASMVDFFKAHLLRDAP